MPLGNSRIGRTQFDTRAEEKLGYNERVVGDDGRFDGGDRNRREALRKTTSNVCPARWVGTMTCCTRSAEARRFKKLIVDGAD